MNERTTSEHISLGFKEPLLFFFQVKIGDFGLMRLLPSEDDVYIMNPLGKVAVAW